MRRRADTQTNPTNPPTTTNRHETITPFAATHSILFTKRSEEEVDGPEPEFLVIIEAVSAN